MSGFLQIECGDSLWKFSSKCQCRGSRLIDGLTLLEGVNEILFALSLFLTDLGEIRHRRSPRNVVEQLWVW